MSKIIMIAEKINNEFKFIKQLKNITNKPISEIKDCLANKKPFFEGVLEGNSRSENEDIIIRILLFTNQDGDKIKLFKMLDIHNTTYNLDSNNQMYEMTQEMFENSIKTREKTRKYFDDLDEMNVNDEEEQS